MVEIDTNKITSFIKENAGEVPEQTRTSKGSKFPEEIVKVLETKIKESKSKTNPTGAFTLDAKKLNALLGYKKDAKYNKNYMLKQRLNKQYPRAEGKEWHVGSINGGELYTFEIRDVKVKETKEEE